MERAPKTRSAVSPHPLSCPRCGCPESRVIRTQRQSQSDPPQPLPAVVRTHRCVHCDKQYRSCQTIEEVSLGSHAWRARIGQQVISMEDVPIGEFAGTWTRYTAIVTIPTPSEDFDANGRRVRGTKEITYEIDTRNEMRSEDYPCRVLVTDKGIMVRSVT